ncbi:hypothetical protein GHJ83_10260, partial [Sinorhizobium meliloti]|nr:hypothetical protein [Sinorhizobium meliloti]MQV59494.1 hypothetical protein [Sinorhizobium meliloti]
FFQPKDLVWLDPCDEHRDEEIKQAAAQFRISTGLRRNPPSSSPACRRSPSGTGRLSSSSFRRR